MLGLTRSIFGVRDACGSKGSGQLRGKAMHEGMENQRRILIIAYRRYLVADRALKAARRAALVWFPDLPPKSAMLIGDPGSPIRRLHDRRQRALARLVLVRQELKTAQGRALPRQGKAPLASAQVTRIEARPIGLSARIASSLRPGPAQA